MTANYEARALGVPKTGRAEEVARRFPTLRWANGEDLTQYRRFSARVHEAIARALPGCPVERLGMDENFADVTGLVDASPGGEEGEVLGI